MKRETWNDPAVSRSVVRNFETLVLDGDQDKEIVSELKIRSYPATLLYSSDGKFIGQKEGYMTASQTMDWLQATLR